MTHTLTPEEIYRKGLRSTCPKEISCIGIQYMESGGNYNCFVTLASRKEYFSNTKRREFLVNTVKEIKSWEEQ